jgi:nucleoid DNA-binding protein
MSDVLIEAISEKAELKPEEAEKFLKCFTSIILDEINKGEKVVLDDFGAFLPEKIEGGTAVKFEPDEKFLKALE